MPKKNDDLTGLIDRYIEKENLEDIVGDRFGKYSKYIIQDRALPDVRDGLKPVQRRILYALHKLALTPDKPYKKSARIVGDVIGKYHPHGDTSVYDAMVRMAQDFKYHLPLIDMHGNKGSVDGDPPAAMRYTEARMSEAAAYLLKDIDKKTVSFVPNFDDEEYEPVVLPARFPNLLINGASGISSGYATEIPPHNLFEVINGVIHRMQNPESTLEDLMGFIKGPDFPTGGIVQGVDGIKEAFETGRGRIILKAKTHFENSDIVIDELPYDVNKAQLVRRMDELRFSKQIDGIKEVRDESSKDGLRVVIETKKGFDLEAVLNFLQKKTDMVKSYNYNMVAIHDHRPVQMGLLPLVDAYILHQKDVTINRSNFQLKNAKKRLHIVEGIILMTDHIDQVIALIRGAKDKTNAREKLVEVLAFSEEQAEAILTLQLYRLSSTDVKALEAEAKELKNTIEALQRILSNERELEQTIEEELRLMTADLAVARRSEIEADIERITVEATALIQSEQMMLGITKDGYVRLSSLRSYKATDEVSFKEGDGFLFEQEVSTLSTLLIFFKEGSYIYLPIYKIGESKWKDLGAHINTLLGLDEPLTVLKVHVVDQFDTPDQFLLTTASNMVKRTDISEYHVTRYNKPLKAIGLNKGDHLVSVERMSQASIEVLTLSSRGRLLKYDASEIPSTGLSARGVKAMKLSQKEFLVKSVPLLNGHDLLVLTSRGTIKRLELAELPKKHRTQSPAEAYKPLKTKAVEAVDMVLLDAAHYRQKTDLFILTSKTTVKTPVFELKLNVADLGKSITQPKHGNPLLMRYPVIELAPENTPLSTYLQSLSDKSPQQLSLEVMDDLLS